MLKYHKYRISRKALESCYISFVRPIIEYGDILYDSCTQELSNSIEKLQHEAARTVTGAKFRSSPELLYKELGWTSLFNRRKIHKLTKIYSITNKIAPDYLCQILESFQHKHRHSTRIAQSTNHLNYPVPKKEFFNKSFFPSAIREWNKLDNVTTSAPSLAAFTKRLRKLNNVLPYFISSKIDRQSQVIIAQLRVNFSDLNHHLFMKGCTDSPQCSCGHDTENIGHFLFSCPQYQALRVTLLDKIERLNIGQPITTNTLLYGNELPKETFCLVQQYLSEMFKSSKRFLTTRTKPTLMRTELANQPQLYHNLLRLMKY